MQCCWMPWSAPNKARPTTSEPGVIKQRLVWPGQGKSGGYRAIIFFRPAERAVFIYGFPKSERENITAEEEKVFKEAAKHVLALTDKQIAELVRVWR